MPSQNDTYSVHSSANTQIMMRNISMLISVSAAKQGWRASGLLQPTQTVFNIRPENARSSFTTKTCPSVQNVV